MRNVKGIISLVSSMLFIWLLPSISVSEEHMITFEMGESGHSISFPMSQREILEAERTDKAIDGINQRKRRSKQRMMESYELVESGITIDFPMSDQKISEAQSKYKQLVIHQDKISERQEEMGKRFEIYEMAESGIIIKFER